MGEKADGKNSNIQKLSNTLLYNSWDKEEVSRVFRKQFKLNGNKNTEYENSRNSANSVLLRNI